MLLQNIKFILSCYTILIIIVLLALLAPAAVTYLWFNFQKAMVKHEVKRKMISGISNDDLVLLKLTKEQSITLLRWEHSKEFEYNDQMYDVVKQEQKDDTIYYWCWLDHEETKLNKQLTKLINKSLNSDPQRKEKTERLFSFYRSLFYQFDGYVNYDHPPQKSRINSTGFFQYESRSIPPPTPPPQLG